MKFVLLGNSITYNMEIGGCETVSIPGLDWCGAKQHILDNLEMFRDSHVFIVVGPVRFTSLHRSRKEVAFVEPKQTVHEIFSSFFSDDRNFNIIPIIATVYPMSFSVYNEKKAVRPIMTSFYKEWDDKIRRYCVIENRNIVHFNERNGYMTPFIHRRLFHRHNTNYTFRLHHATDGLHPRSSIKSEWARIIRKIVKKLFDNQRNR